MSTKTRYCFVCDIAVSNRFFYLATCRTQSSKKKLVEKLGHLVGEKYMVVITEDDVICRSCANLMNTLDRLETEMTSVRRVVLKFLEKKYSLGEGELLNQRANTPNAEIEKQSSTSFLMRKKKADEEFENDVEGSAEDPKSRIWLQCDRCQYTTNYTSFVNNHIRNEVCLNCEAPMKNGTCTQECEKEKDTPQVINEPKETVRFVENNMGFLNGTTDEGFSLMPEGETEKLEVTLNVNETGEISLTEDREEKESKPAVYFHVVGEDDEFDNSNVRQVLAVTGADGAVEMMEVMWDEEETDSPVAEIPF